MKTTPTSLGDLEANVVAPIGTLSLELLQRWSTAAGHRHVQVNLTNVRTRKAALQAIGKVFGFPRWYGANLDALYDCLTDLAETQPAPGYVVVLLGFGDNAPREGLSAEDRAQILDVFRDAVTASAGGTAPLRVLYG